MFGGLPPSGARSANPGDTAPVKARSKVKRSFPCIASPRYLESSEGEAPAEKPLPHPYYFKQMFFIKVLKLRRIYVCISRQREACRKPTCHENAAIYRPLLDYLEKE